MTIGCLLLCLAGCASTPASIEKLKTEIPKKFPETEAPGAVFAVYQGPQLKPLIMQTLGYADEQHTRPISRRDHFRIASITKTFVGTVVLKLAEEGKLKLDDPVSKYVDGVPNGDKITIAMLGYHTSGLPAAIANPVFQKAVEANPQRPWTIDEILPYAWQKPMLFPPGKGWMYSNTNTMLLGKVIEKVTGKPWYRVIQEMILDPLGLKETGYPGNGDIPKPFPRGYRNGQKDNLVRYGDYWFDATQWTGSCWNASGNMYSTVDDLAKFMRAAARGDLVNAQSRKVLFAWIHTGYEGVDYGFHIAMKDGAIGSTGDVPGYSASAVYLPKKDLTIVCLANLTATKGKETSASVLGELAVRIINETP